LVRINFDLDDHLYLKFKDKVGQGNISSTFRDFAISYVSNETNHKLKLDLKKFNKKKNEIETKIKIVQFQLTQLELKKEKEQKEQDKLNQEQLNFDPFAHLTGKARLNESQVLLYRIEKNKTIPLWAKKRSPKNPKGYAIKILKKIIKEIKNDI